MLVAGLAIGLVSWRESVAHLGDPSFVLPPGFPEGTKHAQYHVFREVCGDVAKMAVFLLVFFGPARYRTPQTWRIVLILMIGYYAPFWVGKPFLRELSAPNRVASAAHVAMAAFAFAALLTSRPRFRSKDTMS